MYSRCDDVLTRIKDGKYYNIKLKIYTIEYLNDVVDELGVLERYEDCIFIRDFIDKRFNHYENFKNPVIWLGFLFSIYQD